MALTSLAGVAAMLLCFMVFLAWDTKRQVKTAVVKSQALADKHEKIVLYDEILTMSALMASATGDARWIERSAFAHALDGDPETARQLLSGARYQALKQAYADGMAEAGAILRAEARDTTDVIERRAETNLATAIVVLVTLVVIWIWVWRLFDGWRTTQIRLLSATDQA
jgi:hypothetical protein